MAIKSEAQKKAVAKYKEAKYSKICVDYPSDFVLKVKEAKEASGQSLAGYIRQAIEDRMERDKQAQE